jgi:hypothetical protein
MTEKCSMLCLLMLCLSLLLLLEKLADTDLDSDFRTTPNSSTVCCQQQRAPTDLSMLVSR